MGGDCTLENYDFFFWGLLRVVQSHSLQTESYCKTTVFFLQRDEARLLVRMLLEDRATKRSTRGACRPCSRRGGKVGGGNAFSS